MAEEIGLTATLEGANFFDGVAQYSSALGQMNAATDGAVGELNTATDALEDVGAAAQSAAVDVEESGGAFESIGDAAKGAGDIAKGAMKGMQLGSKLLGAELKLLDQAFDFAAENAERLGKTDVVDSIAEMRSKVDGLKDSLLQLPIPLIPIPGVESRSFLDWMGDAAEGASTLIDVTRSAGTVFELWTGQIDQGTAAGRLYTDLQADAAAATIDHTATLDAHERSMAGAIVVTDGLAASTGNLTGAGGALAGALGEVVIKTDILSSATQALTAELIFSQAAKDLDEASALRLGLAMGLLDAETVGALTQLGELRTAADSNRDGFISAAEAAAGYTEDVIRLAQAADAANGKHIAISIDVTENRKISGEISDAIDFGPAGGREIGNAEGGAYHVTQPTRFLAGEAGPEDAYFIPQGKSWNDVVGGGGMMSESVVNNTYNYTINANYPMQSERSVAADVRMLEMLQN